MCTMTSNKKQSEVIGCFILINIFNLISLFNIFYRKKIIAKSLFSPTKYVDYTYPIQCSYLLCAAPG